MHSHLLFLMALGAIVQAQDIHEEYLVKDSILEPSPVDEISLTATATSDVFLSPTATGGGVSLGGSTTREASLSASPTSDVYLSGTPTTGVSLTATYTSATLIRPSTTLTTLTTLTHAPTGGSTTKTSKVSTTLKPSSTSTPLAPSALPTVVSASYSGNGCDAGSLTMPPGATLNSTVFSLPHFDIEQPGTANTKNCQLHLSLEGIADGWQFALSGAEMGGLEYHISDGEVVRIYLTTFFSQDAAATNSMTYELDQNGVGYLILDVPKEDLVWSPCNSNAIFNINTRVWLASRDSGSVSYFGTQPILERFGYVWRRCA